MPPLNWAARVRTIGRLGCRGRAAPGMHTFNDGPSATLADGFKTTEVIPMSWLERNEAPIQPEEMELEKIPKGWVLTAWPRTTKSLFFRLRLTECLNMGNPFRIACEVRLPGCTEFEQITEFEAWGHELLCVDGRAAGWSELPPSLRPEFLTMARTL